MTVPPIRVLVVEDSLTFRALIVRALRADPGYQVVGETASGEEAVALCERLRPDVITLDLLLASRMSGLEVTEHIMAFCPTPILIVSGSTNRGEVLRTLDALAAGAVEVIEKPRGDEPPGAWERGLLSAVRLVSRIQVITHIRGRTRGRMASTGSAPPTAAGGIARSPQPAPTSERRYRLVALGASTGGPGAVATVLRSLSESTPLPVLVVIHLGRPFGSALVEWLDSVVPMPVREARDGDPLPRPGEAQAIMAPPDHHMIVEAGRLRLTSSPERHGCRPSVDALFESLAVELGASAVGCLLTGMGRDGAEGLLAMRRAGAATIAQDESTSVVFGMPREAIRLGAAVRVLGLPEIGPAIAALAGARRV